MKMILEMTLVQTQNMYGNFYEYLDRERVIINDGDEDAMPAILKFITKNIDYIDNSIQDKSLIANIKNLASLDVIELACLRYMLSTYGIDVLTYIVSEGEDNAKELQTGVVEYNVIDTNDYMTPSIPFATKLTMDADKVSLSGLFNKINELYSLFDGDLFADFGNPIVSYSNVLETSEKLTGIVMPTVTNQINSILGFLGIKLTVITNSEPVLI